MSFTVERREDLHRNERWIRGLRGIPSYELSEAPEARFTDIPSETRVINEQVLQEDGTLVQRTYYKQQVRCRLPTPDRQDISHVVEYPIWMPLEMSPIDMSQAD